MLFSIFSWPMTSTQYLCFVLTPTCMFFSLLFVECSKRTVVFISTATLAILHHVRFHGELLFLARTGFSLIHVVLSLKFGHDLSLVFVFSFLDILRFSNLMIDVLVMMTSRFWG